MPPSFQGMVGKGWVRGHLALRQGLPRLHPAFPPKDGDPIAYAYPLYHLLSHIKQRTLSGFALFISSPHALFRSRKKLSPDARERTMFGDAGYDGQAYNHARPS